MICTKENARHSNDETNDSQNATGEIVETKASKAWRKAIATIDNSQPRVTNGALDNMCNIRIVVIVNNREATRCIVRVGEGVDGAGYAHTDRRFHGTPVVPSCPIENDSIFEVVIGNRKPGTEVVVDVHVEERHQGRVAELAGSRWFRT